MPNGGKLRVELKRRLFLRKEVLKTVQRGGDGCGGGTVNSAK